MIKEKRKNTGKVIYDHLVKNWDQTDDSTLNEQSTERMKKYRVDLIECVEKNKKIFDGDIWVDVQKKTETLFKKRVHKKYFFAKQACPSPTTDQDVFRYNRKEDRIEYIWSVPDEAHCQIMMMDPLSVPHDKRDLLNFVIDFKEGKLLERAKKLNGETKESPIFVKG